MGLEIRGGSSDFCATEGEPRNQSNRYFMSVHCVHWAALGSPDAITSLSELLALYCPLLPCRKGNLPIC